MADEETRIVKRTRKVLESARTTAIIMGASPADWTEVLIIELAALILAQPRHAEALENTIAGIRLMYRAGLEVVEEDAAMEEISNPRIGDDAVDDLLARTIGKVQR